VPKLGPHNHPIVATAKVVAPNTNIGSKPMTLAAQPSISWEAITGPKIPMAVLAVMTLEPRLR
jgi:hypothetical protein